MSFYILLGIMLFLLGLSSFIFGTLFMYNNYMLLKDWDIISINSSNIVMTLLFDWMSLLLMSCVLLISSMVVFYSYSYMHHDVYKVRFLYLVMMFIISMMFMIMSPNLISIFF